MTPGAEDALVRANENPGEARMIAALPLARAAAETIAEAARFVERVTALLLRTCAEGP